jgi:hypothetical protein
MPAAEAGLTDWGKGWVILLGLGMGGSGQLALRA